MPVTGSITTRFVDEKGLDLGKTLIEKDYLISVYPNIVNQLDTPMLMGWGFNTYGGLGDNTTTYRYFPDQTIARGNNWKMVSTGTWVTAAVKADGTLWLWGGNFYGNLGDNTRTDKSSPVQTVAFGNNWKQVSIGHVSLDTAAIKTDGTLWTWGRNSNGQLGNNTTVDRSSPVQTVAFGTNWKQVECGYNCTLSIKTDGTLWCWGQNAYGKLGNNTTTNCSSPVQTVTFGINWKQVSAGFHFCGAVKTDGTLWTWGRNNYGQLGDNTATNRSSPVQTVTFGTNWNSLSCGNLHAGGIKTDGTLWLWGNNSSGEIGDNTTISRSSPVQTVAFGTSWKSVACGSTSTVAIKKDGTLWCWGDNTWGALGDNTGVNKSSPVQTVIYGATWKQASCWDATFAIKDGDF